MLFRYCASPYYGRFIEPNETDAVSYWSGRRVREGIDSHNWQRSESPPRIAQARSYKIVAPHRQQTIKGRLRAALQRAFPYAQHADLSALVRQILKRVRFAALDVDNPETHIAFSPDGVGARDYKRRRSLTFAKFIRRKCSSLFTGRFALSDAALDLASAGFRLPVPLANHIKIVSGAAAHAVYADREHGISSCMSGGESKNKYCEDYFCRNASNMRLVIAREGDALALRSKLITNDDGTYFLDRIYWNSSTSIAAFSQEAHLREALVVALQAMGIELVNYYDFTLNHREGWYMPYCDHADQYDREDSRHVRFHKNGDYAAGSTDGEDASCGSKCCCCGCQVDDDDSRSNDVGDEYCESCFSQHYSYDEYSECDIAAEDCVEAYRVRGSRRESLYTHRDNCHELFNGDYGIEDDCVELVDGSYALRDDDEICGLSNGDYAKSDDCCCCESPGEYELTEDCVQLPNGDYELTTDCVELLDGAWALATDAVQTIDGDWILADGAIEITDDYGTVVYLELVA